MCERSVVDDYVHHLQYRNIIIQDFASIWKALEMIGQFYLVMFVVSIQMLEQKEDNYNISYICYIYDEKKND